MGDTPDIPDSCLNDNHDFDQTGRCRDCNMDRAATADSWGERRTGGAGSRTHALTNDEYREQLRKIGSRE